MNKALFLDRDGVINEDNHLISSPEQVVIIPGISKIISLAKKRGYKVIVVTNQTVISRGIISLSEVENIHSYIEDKLKQESKYSIIDKFYICPYHPDAQILKYRKHSHLRKPSPGMLHLAKSDLNINLRHSFMIGDRVSDIIAGNKANCQTILLKSGEHNSPIIKSDAQFADSDCTPNFISENTNELCSILEKLL